MRILGVDPGLAKCGLALYDGLTWKVKTIRTPPAMPLGHRLDYLAMHAGIFAGAPVDLIVVEHQQKYANEDDKKTKDLFDIQAVGYIIAGRIPHTRLLPAIPAAWKGQVPKKIHHARIRARIPDLPRCSADAMDAVGLALYGADRRI